MSAACRGDAPAATPSSADALNAARAALAPGQSAWLVGGCVRDELLGLSSRDVDIAVEAGAEALARGIADRLGGAVYATSDAFGTWRVVAGALHVDVARLRPAPPDAPAGADPLTADLLGRDVTVNALARPLAGGDLIDPLGGAADLRARRLRLCSPGSLAADPLRILRLARLARSFALAPEPQALAAAAQTASRLADVSGERLRDELSALLALRAAADGLRDLAEWGALAVVLPEVDALRGVDQNPYHHHDVFGHTLEAVGYVADVVAQLEGRDYLATPEEAGLPGVAPLVPVTWAVLLHDIGKPAAREIAADGRVIFWHHDEIGSRMALALARRLRMSSRFAAYLSVLVRQHLRLGFLTREGSLTPRAVARYRRAVSPWVFESVVVSLCDRLATRGEKTSLVAMARHYRVARAVWTRVGKAPVPRLLDGNEVMALLGLTPGPAVGDALAALAEEVDAGEVRDKDEARVFLRTWWQARTAASGTEESDAGAA